MPESTRQAASAEHKAAHQRPVCLPESLLSNRCTLALSKPGLIQPKLRIGPADDAFEREADRLADAVMRMSGSESGSSAVQQAPAGHAQRMCAKCEEEGATLRRQPRGEQRNEAEQGGRFRPGGASVTDPARAGLRGNGKPLPASARSFFQPRFGHDFGGVRVHSDEEAARAARSIGARAFTFGRHIAFAAGEFAPETSAGRHLLAHELTHVVQQAAAPRLRSTRRDVERAAPALPIVMRKATDPECTKSAKAATATATASKHVPSTEHCTVTEIKESEIEAHLALDQITVAVFGTADCEGCEELGQKLEQHCRTAWGRKPVASAKRDFEAEGNFRLKILRVKTSGVTGSGPVARIYFEHTLEDDGRTLGAPLPVLTRLSEIASSATTPGWPLGLGIGAALGALGGIAAGIGVGLALAGGGMIVGGAAVLGAVTGIGILGIGLGLGALVGHLLDEPQVVALDDERRRELHEYLCMIRKHGPQGETSLARDAVTLWGELGFKGADPRFDVSIRRRLIRDLVDGTTGDREERAIIKILERSSNDEFLEFLDPAVPVADRVTMQDLDQNIEGSESRYTLELLEQRFAALGKQPGAPNIERAARPGGAGCDARQAIMIHFAEDQAAAMALTTEQRLAAYIGNEAAHPDVAAALNCYFDGATAAQIARIRAVFQQILKLVPNRRYICPGTEEVRLPNPGGSITHRCTSTIAFIARSADPRVFVCPAFFESDARPRDQAVTFLHEWAHRAGNLTGETYGPRCRQLSLAVALDNADSYALLAHFITHSAFYVSPRSWG